MEQTRSIKGDVKVTEISNKIRNKKLWIAAGVVAAVLLIFAIYKIQAAAKDAKTYSAVSLRVKEPLVLKGNSESAQRQAVLSDPTKGEVNEVFVTDRQAVQAGDVLFDYLSEPLENQAAEAQKQYNRAVDNYDASEAELADAWDREAENERSLETARANLEAAEDELNNVDMGQTTGDTEETTAGIHQYIADISQFIAGLAQSTAGTDQYTAALEQAAADVQQYTAEVKQYESQQQVLANEVRQLEKAVRQAANVRDDAYDRLTQSESASVNQATAQIDGIVLVYPENKQAQGLPFMEIISQDTLIKATVTEYDLNKLTEGEDVEILVVPTRETVRGKIAAISILPEKAAMTSGLISSGINYAFTVKPEKAIIYGYSVEISIATEEIVIPREAVLTEGETTFVYQLTDGKAYKKAVKVRDTGTYLTLVEGLAIGDTIIENPDGELKDGKDVQVSP